MHHMAIYWGLSEREGNMLVLPGTKEGREVEVNIISHVGKIVYNPCRCFQSLTLYFLGSIYQ